MERRGIGSRACGRVDVACGIVAVCLGGLSACTDPTDVTVAHVEVTPSALSLGALGETATLVAEGRTASGRPVSGGSVRWSSADPSVASVDPATGVVVASANGTTSITAAIDGAEGTARVTVQQEVARLAVTPDSRVVSLGSVLQLAVEAFDARDHAIPDVGVRWTSTDDRIAAVSASGLVEVVGDALGPAEVTATAAGISGSALVEVAAHFVSLRVGGGSHRGHACAIVDTGATYCWGDNAHGQAGPGGDPVLERPTFVSRDFESVDAGGFHVCGKTATGGAFCWGGNGAGALGDATQTDSDVPVAVETDQTFEQVESGWHHTCAVASGGDAYCWGGNSYGELGNGLRDLSTVPVPVGRTGLEAVSAGGLHTCAIDGDGLASCWGMNAYGQLGQGTSVAWSLDPVDVYGGLAFGSITAGYYHTCGLVDRTAYCWGSSSRGQLGTGSIANRTVPFPVSGGLEFEMLSAGTFHTCGIAAGGTAYCWGRGESGQLGTGSLDDALEPTPVTRGLDFIAISAGDTHTCAITRDGVAYCWGDNMSAELADGTRVDRTVPVRVLGSGGLGAVPPASGI